MIGTIQEPIGPVESQPEPRAVESGVRRMSASFWLRFMFWWTQYYPRFVLVTRPLFLWFAWRYSKVLRRGTLANARRILGEHSSTRQREALAKSVIRNFYLSVYELGQHVRQTREQLAKQIDGVSNRERYFDVRAQKRGAIVVTAHLGGFELGMLALSEKEKRVHVVYHRDAIPRFDRLRSRLRNLIGVIESPVDDGWSLWIRLRDALLADEVVVLQADRIMPGQRGQRVPFFDGHIEMPPGPVKLALATGAPIIPILSIRTAVGRVKIVIEEAIFVSRADGPVNGAHPAFRHIASALERHVRANPEQWSMVYPVWCEDQIDGPVTN
ncbi:MAG: lysophospholipid acyltransferase family protein [Planctomycetes bacterium]|nr:lysophospholipid acyltransferase family protein [Planctomycetota bacterium]